MARKKATPHRSGVCKGATERSEALGTVLPTSRVSTNTYLVCSWTRTTLKGTRGRRLYNYYYYNSRSRNQQPEWSFLGCGGKAVGPNGETRCLAMCAACCGESTTLAGQARVFACGKTITAATLPPWGASKGRYTFVYLIFYLVSSQSRVILNGKQRRRTYNYFKMLYTFL